LKYRKNRVQDFPPRTLGEHIRTRRQGLALRQIDLAIAWQVDEHSVVNWEKGASPNDRYYPRILEFLGYDPRPEPGALGEQLIWKRQGLGLPRKQAAKLIGVDEGSLARWERGTRQPTGIRLDMVNRFLNALT
jgi:DNA-binding transcriptional regulator YiaG